MPCQCMDAYIVKLRCFLHSVVFTFYLFYFFTDRKGLSETAHHLPEQEACSGRRWCQGGQGKAPPLPQKCGAGLQNPKRGTSLFITFLTGNVLLAANDFFLTMVFQAFRVLTIVPFGNADAVISLKGQIGVR